MTDEHIKICEKMNATLFGSLLPTYLLDDTFRFLKWNKSFDLVIAREFDLTIGGHASKLVNLFENGEDSLDRAARVFGMGEMPKWDHENLILKTNNYGTIHFEKLALYMENIDDLDSFWRVSFNINQADSLSLLFDDLLKCVS